MALDFFNKLKENLSKNEILSNISDGINEFITDVADRLNDKNSEEIDIVSKIISNRKTSIASETSIIQARDEILANYAQNTKEKGDLFFVFNKVKGTDEYRIIQMGENTNKTITVEKSKLPNDTKLNYVMRLENGKYTLDTEGTNEIINKIYKKAEEILNRQDEKLDEYRKEGHVYVVSEDINNRIFLWDTTDKPDFEIEEVNFPTELLSEAKEGNRFIYKNGKYEKID